jgi:hypothetical protein
MWNLKMGGSAQLKLQGGKGIIVMIFQTASGVSHCSQQFQASQLDNLELGKKSGEAEQVCV